MESPTDYSFNEWVHKYPEITHSGIACHVNELDPQFMKYNGDKIVEALTRLERYASTSITAYRAIEWWAAMPIGPPQLLINGFGKDTLAEMIFKRITKPTHYWQPSCEKIEIKE